RRLTSNEFPSRSTAPPVSTVTVPLSDPLPPDSATVQPVRPFSKPQAVGVVPPPPSSPPPGGFVPPPPPPPPPRPSTPTPPAPTRQDLEWEPGHGVMEVTLTAGPEVFHRQDAGSRLADVPEVIGIGRD